MRGSGCGAVSHRLCGRWWLRQAAGLGKQTRTRAAAWAESDASGCDTLRSCVGIPGATWIVIRVARLVRTHRMRIVAALSAIGLTVAQLAPSRNARRP